MIYGGGAVGLGIASCLLAAGEQVTILARPGTARLLAQEGLLRTGLFGRAFAAADRFDVASTLDDLQPARYDHVLVCCKSFDSAAAACDLAAHRHLLAEQARIVLLQNGWGNAQKFTRFFSRDMVYNARVITGFTRPAPNHVEVTVHADAIHVGSLYREDLSSIAGLCAAIAAGGIPCQAVPEIGKDLWAKMLFNCPLNAVGALLGLLYGALAESEHARRVMELIIGEVFAVMDAAGYASHWHTPADYLPVFYGSLVPRTARHYSSTLQDLRAGKRTEIDALNGAVVGLGKDHGVTVPANETVYQLIKQLEHSS
jgi:2-dehydropantoate 2-reductase